MISKDTEFAVVKLPRCLGRGGAKAIRRLGEFFQFAFFQFSD